MRAVSMPCCWNGTTVTAPADNDGRGMTRTGDCDVNPAAGERQTVPGVLVRMYGTGILLVGESGSGKSELALGLLERGHALVADDAVECARGGDGEVVGSCPRALRGRIEVRGLGLLDVDRLFGAAGSCGQTVIDLIVELKPVHDRQAWADWPRLSAAWGRTNLLGKRLPRLLIPVAPGRQLPLLVETAVRTYTGRR